jgi:hypothetical protein
LKLIYNISYWFEIRCCELIFQSCCLDSRKFSFPPMAWNFCREICFLIRQNPIKTLQVYHKVRKKMFKLIFCSVELFVLPRFCPKQLLFDTAFVWENFCLMEFLFDTALVRQSICSTQLFVLQSFCTKQLLFGTAEQDF